MSHHGGHESPLELEVALLSRHLRVDDGEDLVVAEHDSVGGWDSVVKPPPLVRLCRRCRCGSVIVLPGSAAVLPVEEADEFRV